MADDDVTIYADAAAFPAVYLLLESVADRPKDIRFTADGPLARGLIVSQELYQRYRERTEELMASIEGELGTSMPPEEPKKRGRPRRDTASEEPTP